MRARGLTVLGLALALAAATYGGRLSAGTASATLPAARGASTAHAAKPAALYQRRATVACLAKRGVLVGSIRPSNRRLRALHDLAQKTSLQAGIRGAVIGLAFGRSEADAGLLLELLRVPNDPYRLERLRNVVLLSPSSAKAARAAVLACLTP